MRNKLRDFVQPRREKVLPSQVPHLPYVGMEHVEAHTMRLVSTASALTMKSSANRFYAGDVLYGRLRPYLNKVLRADFDGICSPEFIVLPKTPGLHPDFIRYRLNAHDFVTFTSHLNAGDRPRVDFDSISEFAVVVPDESGQKRIVAYLDEQLSRLDASVAALHRVQTNLKRYRASVLKSACEGRLVPTEAELARAEGTTFETGEQLLSHVLRKRSGLAEGKLESSERTDPQLAELASLPEGWALATTAEVCARIVDCHNKTAPYVDDGVPLVRTSNIRDGTLNFDGIRFVSAETYEFWSRRLKPQTGDVLFTREAPMGEAAIIPLNRTVCMGQRVMALRPSVGLRSEYLLYALMAPQMWQFIESVAVGSGVKHLRVGDVERLPIPLPPLAEQHRIVAEADRRLSLIRATEVQVSANLARAKRLRQSILQAAFAMPAQAGQ
jgi:type I restriction enzyme S subunit